MAPAFDIRTATLQELPQLLAFEQGIIAAERPYDACLKPDPISYYDLAALVESDRAEVVVAHQGEQLIGSGYAKLVEAKPYYRNPIEAYLGFMYVDPLWRGQGVNQAVVDVLLSWALEQGVTDASLTVYSDNAGAIRAYEKAGFAPHILEMRLDMKATTDEGHHE